MRRALLFLAFSLAATQAFPQTQLFRGIVKGYSNGHLVQFAAGRIIFPLAKDTLVLDTANAIVHINLANTGLRVFYYDWGPGWQSRIFHFDTGICTDTLVTINAQEPEWYTPFRRSKTCPICRSSRKIIPVVYGLPTRATFKKAGRNKIRLGGCIISPDAPKFYCTRDEFEF